MSKSFNIIIDSSETSASLCCCIITFIKARIPTSALFFFFPLFLLTPSLFLPPFSLFTSLAWISLSSYVLSCLPFFFFSSAFLSLLQCITSKHINISSPLPSNALPSLSALTTLLFHLLFPSACIIHTFCLSRNHIFSCRFLKFILKWFFLNLWMWPSSLKGNCPLLWLPLLWQAVLWDFKGVDALGVTVREVLQ